MNTYAVGDEVGFVRYGGWHGTMLSQGISRVTNINRYGHIHLENGRQFDRNGDERNVKYGGARLIAADQLRAQLDKAQADRQRAQAAQELVKLIEGQRDGYGRHHEVSDDIRARMQDLVNRL